MRHITVILLILSLGTHALSAQTVAAGNRVRITSAHYALKGRVGRVLSETPATILVRFNELHDDTLTLARSAIDRLEVRNASGGEPPTKRGALIGFGIGAGVGLVAGFATYKECHPRQWLDMHCLFQPTSGAASAVMGAAVVGVVGAAVGGLIGSMSRNDGWVTAAPSGVGLAIWF